MGTRKPSVCSRRTRDPESKCLSFENHPFAMIKTCSQTLVSTVRTRLATKLWMVSTEPIALRFNSISMRSLSRNNAGHDCLPMQNLLMKYSDVLRDLSYNGLKNVTTYHATRNHLPRRRTDRSLPSESKKVTPTISRVGCGRSKFSRRLEFFTTRLRESVIQQFPA